MAVSSGSYTIKTSGGHYSTWAAACDDIANLTGDLTFTADASAFTENTAPGALTETLGGYTLTFTAATFPTTTDATTGPRFTCNYAGNFFDNELEGSGNVITEGIVAIRGSPPPAYLFYCAFVTTGHTWTVRRCIMHGGGSGFYGYDTDATCDVYNNIFMHIAGSMAIRLIAGIPGHVSNNTIINDGTSERAVYMNSAGAATLENNLAYAAFTLSDFDNIGGATGSNNTSYDSSCTDANWGTGTNNRPSKTADPFVDEPNNDYHLAAASDPIGNGKDLSAKFTTDFFGDTRSSWDIGAVKYSAAGITVEPATLQLALTQEAPTVVFPLQTVLPSTFQLALTQHAPSVSVGVVLITPATLALALTQEAPTVMLPLQNDFSSDSDVKAVWNFESGALTTDSKGTNTLTNQGADEDLVDYWQGSCSARFVRANADRMYITDANLDSGFPLKSGEANKVFSLTFWLYLETISVSQYLFYKSDASPNRCMFVWLNGADNKINLTWTSDGTNWDTWVNHASALSVNTPYFVGVTRDAGENYRIRIWDETAQAILGTDLTGLGGDINISASPVYLSFSTPNTIDGNEDEHVVWARALSVADIDAVRAGTYGAGGVDETVTPATLELALTQEAPTVVFPLQTVLPSTFQLALTKHTPTITAGIIIVPATFALALTQHTPSLSLDHTVIIGAVLTLALTQEAPTVVFPLQTVLPDPFSLALAQETPVIITGDVCIVLVDSALELALAVEAPTILKNTLSWSAGLLTYKGITYEISAGVTQKRFVYWDPNYTTVFRTTDVLQDVFDADGWVMCLNESGVAYPAFARKLIHGGIIQAGTITAEYGQIAALTVGGPELKDLAVGEGKLAALSVSSAKIQALAVSEAKLAALAVSEGKLAALSVSSAKIQALAVTAAKIQDLTVDSAKITDLAVTTVKIGNLNVTTPKIADNAVTVLASNYTEGQIVVAITDTTIQTVTFTSTGEAVSIHVSALLDDSSSSGNIEVKLMEGANEVYAEIVLSVSNSMPVPLSFTIEDTPGVGEKTYDLICRGVGGARRAARRSMMIREILK